MLDHLRGLLAPPVFPDDEDKTRQARVLYFLLVSVMAMVFLLAAVAIPLLYTSKLEDYLLILPLAVFLAVAYELMRRGHVKTASTIYISGMWIVFTLTILSAGGIENELVIFHVAGAVAAGLLLGTSGALIYGGMSFLTGLVILILELHGDLPVSNYALSPVAGLTNLTVALILTIAAVSLYTNGLNNALRLTRQRFQALKQAEASLLASGQRLRSLARIERLLSETEQTGIEQILQLIVDSAKELVPAAERAVLHLVEEEQQLLVPRAVAGAPAGFSSPINMHVGEGIAGHAMQIREVINIPDIQLDERFLSDGQLPDGVRSLLAAPIRTGERSLGTISIQSGQPSAFSGDEDQLLGSLGTQAAIALENARLLETTQRSLKEANALYRISQSLAASLDPEQLMQDVVELLHVDFGFYHVQIYEVDADANMLVASHGSGAIGEQLKAQGYRFPVGSGIAGHAAETGQPFTANNIEDVIFFVRNPLLPDTQSEMAVPIKIGGQVLGVLDIQETLPGHLSIRQMQLMEAVADQLAVALQKARLYSNLQDALQQEKAMRSQLIQNERLALVGRLLASVSHELNNPIQAIQNALFLIKEEEKLSEQGRQDLNIVLSETERMAALIGRLRATYRPTRSEDFEAVQLNQVVDDVRLLTAAHMRRQDIRFVLVADPELPKVAGIPDQLRQVVLNLFMNAIEAMPSGGCLTVQTQALIKDGQVLLIFQDTGTGIDPTILPHIFDPFISNKQSGTGLGLTITYDIIRQHHGGLRAENNPDGGATFQVWLPIGRRE